MLNSVCLSAALPHKFMWTLCGYDADAACEVSLRQAYVGLHQVNSPRLTTVPGVALTSYAPGFRPVLRGGIFLPRGTSLMKMCQEVCRMAEWTVLI